MENTENTIQAAVATETEKSNYEQVMSKLDENTAKVLEELFGSLEEQGIDLPGFEDIMLIMMAPKEVFAVLSEQFLDELERGLNDPNERLIMIAQLNGLGIKAEDLLDEYNAISEMIEKELTGKVEQNRIDFLKRCMGILTNVVLETEGIAKRKITVPIELCHPDAKLPEYQHLGDAGADLYALEDYEIKPGETVIIPTGIKMAIPKGYGLLIQARSGMAAKTKLRVCNTPGLIDSNYVDEIKVIMENVESPIADFTYEFDDETHRPVITSILHGKSYYIEKGQRFAQIRLVEVPTIVFNQVGKITEYAEDRGGGLGSSGDK